MAEFEIFFKESVWKDVRKIPKRDLRNILEWIKSLSTNPRPPGCEKLTGQDRYRLRQGRYCIVYSIQDKDLIVWVIKIAHRKDVYC
jgi:mRNA interferase RelE/StbE